MAKAIGGIVGVTLGETHTVPQFALGTITQTDDGGEAVYCIASGAVSQFALSGINEDFKTYMMTTALAAQSDRLGFPRAVLPDRIGVTPSCGMAGATPRWPVPRSS